MTYWAINEYYSSMATNDYSMKKAETIIEGYVYWTVCVLAMWYSIALLNGNGLNWLAIILFNGNDW